MSPSSEKRMPESAPDGSGSGRVVPFEVPLSELQRAIQWRAQAANDAEREREHEARRPKPVRWLVTLALALVPVVMIFGALDAFLRVYYRLIETYMTTPAPVSEVQPAQAISPPQPGVVLLQAYDVHPPEAAAPPATPPAVEPARKAQQENARQENTQQKNARQDDPTP
jgi:hypothetical protein